MVESKTHSGSCHCGKVRYEVTTDLSQVLSCNCSLCSRAGYLLTFVNEDQFRLLSGDDAVTDYQFNQHMIHHVFCTTCGVRSFAHGRDLTGHAMYAVNVRCLEGVDPTTLSIKHVNGRDR